MWPFPKKAKIDDVTLPNGMNLQIITLPDDQYQKEYRQLSSRKAEDDKLEQEFNKFRELLVADLNKIGEESPFMEGDYAVGSELQGSYFLCGAIYSNKMVCSTYLCSILNAMKQLEHPAQWMYHTACEVWMNEDEPLIGDGEFFVIDNKMYVPDDRQSYQELFCK